MYIRRIIFSLMLLLTTSACYAGDISRDHDFTDGEILTAAQLDTAFDEIVNEVNDLDADNLASNIAITTSGNFVLSGTFASSSTFTSTGSAMNFGNGGTDAITINSPGGLTFTPSAVWTFTGAQTVSGTWSNLGTVTTAAFTAISDLGNVATTGTITTGGKITAAGNEIEGSLFDINGGTLDGVTIAGASGHGDTFYNDGSNDVAKLAAGTAGYVLNANGAGAPSWGVDQNAGNCIMSISASHAAQFQIGTDEKPTGPTGNYASWFVHGTSLATFAIQRYVHIDEISTITWYAWCVSTSSDPANIKVDVGGANSTSSTTGTNTDQQWVTNTIDVSGLSDSSVYTITLQASNDGAGNTTHVYHVILIGS